jgi:hypothetical protein
MTDTTDPTASDGAPDAADPTDATDGVDPTGADGTDAADPTGTADLRRTVLTLRVVKLALGVVVSALTALSLLGVI